MTELPGSDQADLKRSAADFVRAYYKALDAQSFEVAWKALAPPVQRRLGPYERWKAGYGQTISSRPLDVVATPVGEVVSVRLTLAARDEGCAGERRFSVTWRLRAVSAQWSATGLSAVALDEGRCG
jgi:hypothetical protein